MSRRLVLGCDKCGRESESVGTLSFTFDEVEYEMELCSECRSEVDAFHESLTASGRRRGGDSAPSEQPKSVSSSRKGKRETVSVEPPTEILAAPVKRRGSQRRGSSAAASAEASLEINPDSGTGKTLKAVPRRLSKATTSKSSPSKAATSKPERVKHDDNGEPKASDVRQWARSQGLDMPERGRLPKSLILRFQAAEQ